MARRLDRGVRRGVEVDLTPTRRHVARQGVVSRANRPAKPRSSSGTCHPTSGGGEALLAAIGRAREACEGMRPRGVIVFGPDNLTLPVEDVRYVESEEHARELFGAGFSLPLQCDAAVYGWITCETGRPRP